MGKKYIHAEMDITEFDVEDIITTSAGEDTGGDNPDPEDDF